jgi:hypothetical protein
MIQLSNVLNVLSELMIMHVDYEILELHDPDVALNNKLGFGCHFWYLNLLAYCRPAAVAWIPTPQVQLQIAQSRYFLI